MSEPIRILLVEDQYFARLAIHTVVDSYGDMAIVAETDQGSQALPLYEAHAPDVVIMDLRLPGISGFEAIAAIHAAHPAARIVVLSNYEGSEDVHRAISAGALGYLTKDASADELATAIQAVHRGRHYLPAALSALLASRVDADALTSRELEVLQLLARGLANKEIAAELGIAEKTARIHVSHILDKLAVEDRTQAVLTAIQRGYVHLT
ncbi:MAG: response regulator transcription factor [Acidobacteria bacterium]|nr:response regulator transcription factor [Acidobacteriota bacterium]